MEALFILICALLAILVVRSLILNWRFELGMLFKHLTEKPSDNFGCVFKWAMVAYDILAFVVRIVLVIWVVFKVIAFIISLFK